MACHGDRPLAAVSRRRFITTRFMSSRGTATATRSPRPRPNSPAHWATASRSRRPTACCASAASGARAASRIARPRCSRLAKRMGKLSSMKITRRYPRARRRPPERWSAKRFTSPAATAAMGRRKTFGRSTWPSAVLPTSAGSRYRHGTARRGRTCSPARKTTGPRTASTFSAAE